MRFQNCDTACESGDPGICHRIGSAVQLWIRHKPGLFLIYVSEAPRPKVGASE